MVCALLVLLLVAGVVPPFSSDVHAGSWLQSEGDAVGATGISYSLSDGFWKRDGTFTRYPTQHQQTTYDLYYAYGYSYYTTLFASTAFTYSDNGMDTTSGLDALKMGITGRINPFRNGRSWQLTAIVPVSELGLSVDRPGSGQYGLDAGLFYRLLPDPYENPFTEYTQGIWGGGIGTTLWGGTASSELWAYGNWEKQVINPSWQVEIKLSALTSYDGGESGSVDIFGPNDSYHYDQVASDFSLRYRLNRTTGIRINYKRDLWGRNINKSEGLNIGLSTTWGK